MLDVETSAVDSLCQVCSSTCDSKVGFDMIRGGSQLEGIASEACLVPWLPLRSTFWLENRRMRREGGSES